MFSLRNKKISVQRKMFPKRLSKAAEYKRTKIVS